MWKGIGFAMMAAGMITTLPKHVAAYRQTRDRDSAMKLFFTGLMITGFVLLAAGHFFHN